VQLGPPATAHERDAAHAASLLSAEAVRSEDEASLMAAELATRYEEIDLLYTIADILGRTVRLEEAAQTIAQELASVVGARRASILVHDEPTGTLRMVAGRGLERLRVTPVAVDDPTSIAARVFREQIMLSHDATSGEPHPGAGPERGYKGTSFVALPITYSPPGGVPRAIGVINLTDRVGSDTFTAGHKKLLAAVASQVGAAIENARLVERERRRVRLDTELMLAQGLQIALMQPALVLRKAGDIAARTIPAESVGGDFYKVVTLREEDLGVLIGDVSSHGLSAAMLMAHAIAAAGFVAHTSDSPEQALESLLEEVGDQLLRAEMHVSFFYGVIDARRGTLRYANAGHPQAFLVPAGRAPQRLAATAPPLGLGSDRHIGGAQVAWTSGDLLCLFSDGVSDLLGAGGAPYGEERLLRIVQREHGRPTQEIVDAVFGDMADYAPGPAGDDRTLLLARR
jgi:sigma-B regulation protein RsbU (phosphoserine phosphatase)